MEKILGLDLGTTTLGIAFSDSLGICHPKEVFRFNKGAYGKAKERVLQLLEEYNIKTIALGYPKHMDDRISDMCKVVTIFKERLLEARPDIEVNLVDERLTSVIAHEKLTEMGIKKEEQLKIVDMYAALEILNTYIARKENDNGIKR